MQISIMETVKKTELQHQLLGDTHQNVLSAYLCQDLTEYKVSWKSVHYFFKIDYHGIYKTYNLSAPPPVNASNIIIYKLLCQSLKYVKFNKILNKDFMGVVKKLAAVPSVLRNTQKCSAAVSVMI